MYGIILAGGRGERMGPLTNDTPKPMLKVGGKPILQYQIEQLKEAGIKDVLLVEGYLPKVIQDYFGDGKGFGVKIQHLEADRGSAGAVRKALESIPESEKNVVLMYGDILSDANIKMLLDKHMDMGNHATFLCIKGNYLYPDGMVSVDENEYLSSIDNPKAVGLVNGAIFALNREKVLPLLPRQGDLSKDVWEGLSKIRPHVFAIYEHEGYWRNMSDAFDVLQAERDFELGLLKGRKETTSSGSVENK